MQSHGRMHCRRLKLAAALAAALAAMPLAGFGLALLLPAVVYRNRRGLKVGG